MTTAKKINVWFLSGWYPTRVHNTRGNFVQKHAEAVSQFCNVAVLHVCTDPDLKQTQEAHVNENPGITELIIYLKPAGKIPLWSPLRHYLQFRQAYRKGSRILEGLFGKPDIIHANIIYPVALFARMLAHKYRIPFCITEHWTGYLKEDPAKPSAMMLFLSKILVRKAVAILPVTEHLGQAMQQMGLKGHYITVNNVVDTKLFQPLPKSGERKAYRLLHISTLHPVQKNFDGLLHALNRLNDIRNDFFLELVSDGDYNAYRDLAKKLDLADNIRFHGKMRTANIAALAAQCDILILFSRYENFPCVIPEAFAAGIPVLSTRVGGIHEHLLPPLGRLVENEDEQSFAGALNDMLHHLDRYDPVELHKYAEKHFSYESVGKKLLSIYQQYIYK